MKKERISEIAKDYAAGHDYPLSAASSIGAAIREAVNEALEEAAVACGSMGDAHETESCSDVIRALKVQ